MGDMTETVLEPEVIVAAIKGNGEVALTGHSETGVTRPPGMATSFAAIFRILFVGRLAAKRDDDIVQVTYADEAYVPIAGCNAHCALNTATPADGVFVPVANVTASGVLFHVYFSHGSGSSGLSALRTIRQGLCDVTTDTSPTSRQTQGSQQNGSGGVVTDYWYQYDSAAVLDEFESALPLGVANLVETVLSNANTIVACMSLIDPTKGGTGITGVATVGWNNDAFALDNDELLGAYNICDRIN
ncbi:hypothetical protein BX600DRAFT_505546 [Xylariales sp. PMI_506]|nr:hypothetical protein BX600DRAFT_505546 [Xylariales sp. PMI_506]